MDMDMDMDMERGTPSDNAHEDNHNVTPTTPLSLHVHGTQNSILGRSKS